MDRGWEWPWHGTFRKERGRLQGWILLVEEDAEAPRGVLGWASGLTPGRGVGAGRDQVAPQPGELPRPRQVGPRADTLRSPEETASLASPKASSWTHLRGDTWWSRTRSQCDSKAKRERVTARLARAQPGERCTARRLAGRAGAPMAIRREPSARLGCPCVPDFHSSVYYFCDRRTSHTQWPPPSRGSDQAAPDPGRRNGGGAPRAAGHRGPGRVEAAPSSTLPAVTSSLRALVAYFRP